MKLSSKNLLFHPIEIDDIDIIHSKTSNYEEVGMFFTTKIKSKSHWIKQFEKSGLWDDNYGMLKILDKKNHELIGVIWYFKSLHYVEGYEIAFNIFNSAKREKGYAAESVNIFSSYLFNAYNINRIQCNTWLPISHPSIEGFKKTTGNKFEGTMRKACYIRGELIDLNLFSLLKEESKKLESLIDNN